MSARRVLILCYFYPPLAGGGVHRVLGFTRHLPEFGWACTVICAGEQDYWVKDETLTEAVPPGTEVIRVRGGSGLAAWMRAGGAGGGRRSGGTFGVLRRLSDWWLIPDSYAGWSRRARDVASRRVAHGDVSVLLSSSPPESVHLAAADVARASGRPWVADFRDPWVPLSFRKPPTAWHAERQRAMERRVIESADLVLAASRSHEAKLREELGAEGADRVEHLPNGFEPAVADDATETETTPTFRVVFTGTLAQMPDTETCLEAVHEVLARRPEARRRIRLRLAGPYESGYEDRSIALGLKGIVEFLGPRSHRETRALQRGADLLMLWKPRGEGFRTMVPGKLYEYLESGRPLIALLDADTEAADLARRGGATVVPPGRRDLLAVEIERSYLAWRETGRAPDARPDWIGAFTRRELSRRLADLLERAREMSR